ncbi:nucleotidyltransferase family protein [Marinicella meishanensis]|uniref:nucleotidyltransferase family protein n=1 Tax=Marinicella meishanensis TaxID=2873263 RepID=UPI001CBD7367|nr:nucleotidyltransferase family protein [Marinicella sp. NBU2979]
MTTHGLILAAGQSQRLGQSKQLLPFQGRSLLRHVEHLLAPLVDQLFVVLGHNHQRLQGELQQAQVIINERWSEGLGSSLQCGLLTAQSGADALLVALCDQPKIPASHYRSLLRQAQAHPGYMVATAYADAPGVPAVFQRPHFTALQQNQGQQGAQKLLQNKAFPLISLACEAAAFDVDCPADIDLMNS